LKNSASRPRLKAIRDNILLLVALVSKKAQ
jgi:hypothetical protein